MLTATTVKLARALWIVPVSFGYGWLATRKGGGESAVKAKKPWFILGFLIAAALVTYVPSLQSVGLVINTIAKRTLVVTLFLIGASLTRETLKEVGVKPLIQGVALWLMAASATLLALKLDWIA